MLGDERTSCIFQHKEIHINKFLIQSTILNSELILQKVLQSLELFSTHKAVLLAWKVVFEFEICGRCRFCGPRGFEGLVSWVVALVIWWLVTIKAEIRPLHYLPSTYSQPPPIAWEHFRIAHDQGWEKRDTTFAFFLFLEKKIMLACTCIKGHISTL